MSYDHRGISIVADVDAAIERIVDHFERNDLALRLDVLRALSARAHLAFETTRVREHLEQHPVSMDLIQGVTTESLVYKILSEKMQVDNHSCNYDIEGNVIMVTTVRWTLGHRNLTKKRKKRIAMITNKKKEKETMTTKYRFERMRQKKEDKVENETRIKFSVFVAFGDDDVSPRELLYFDMACDHPYPKSYYEDQHQPQSDEENEKSDDDESKTKQQEVKVEEQKDEENFGEEQRNFRFDSEVLADIGAWMGADKEELDPVDVVGFFMALPVYEDEWLLDERVCKTLFQNESEGEDEK
ncbi:hypothetical protein PsorP6_007628 [Peronosclerospora sorghi]|uniref:Uncharacterized protein n=1 Tax=Peronosclerospora sorghi TaxID=230839 RepID=A0ACC0W8T7_9STRA|nr:hypothetical protein PsorP6_007628 [Peronosclerospora sorghi]